MKRITAARLDRYRQIEIQRKELAAQARTLETEAKAIAKEAEADLVATGRDSCRRGAYTLCWENGKGSVSWKGEFVRVAGAEAASAITAPAVRKFRIVHPETAPCPTNSPSEPTGSTARSKTTPLAAS